MNEETSTSIVEELKKFNSRIYSKKLREIPGKDRILYENKRMKLTLSIGYSLTGVHYFKYIKGNYNHYTGGYDMGTEPYDDIAMCRIRLDRPEYLECDDTVIKQYKLTKRDKENLSDVLFNREPICMVDEFPIVYEALVKYQDEMQLSDLDDRKFLDEYIEKFYPEEYKNYQYTSLKAKFVDYMNLK